MHVFPEQRPLLIGVVHLLPTPGSPRRAAAERGCSALLDHAAADARALREGGCDALIVENFGDAPFFKTDVPAETIAALALAVEAVRAAAPGLAVGVNVLRNDARAALGICAATGAAFVRVNVHTGSAATDQGLIEGDAARTLRERARLCPDVALLVDVHVKHATPMGRETIAEAADEALGRGLADGVIVSGRSTGRAPDARDLAAVREVAAGRLVFVGSGLDAGNARELLTHADGAFVGTAFKRGGRLEEPVDVERVRRLRGVLDA